MNKIIITASTHESKEDIHKLLESIFWDGEYSDEFNDVDWTIQQLILSSQSDNPEYPKNGSTLMECSHGRKGWLCIACIATESPRVISDNNSLRSLSLAINQRRNEYELTQIIYVTIDSYYYNYTT